MVPECKSDSNAPVDEIDDFWQARYLSAGEAAWRILGFRLTTKDPAISALPVDTPHSIHHIQYSRRNSRSSTMSKLYRYFFRPEGVFFDHAQVPISFEQLTYAEYFHRFRLQKLALHKPGTHFLEVSNPSQQPIMSVVQRGPTNRHVTRIQPISPSQGERFYIRALLLTKPARSFDDLRTVDGAMKPSFQEAAKQFGLFVDECEDLFTLREAASLLYTPKQLRNLFIDMLTNDCCILPIAIWNSMQMDLAQDFMVKYCDEEKALNLCLENIGVALKDQGKSLHGYGLAQRVSYAREVTQEFDRWQPHSHDLALQCEHATSSFNPQQRMVFSEIDKAMSTANHYTISLSLTFCFRTAVFSTQSPNDGNPPLSLSRTLQFSCSAC